MAGVRTRGAAAEVVRSVIAALIYGAAPAPSKHLYQGALQAWLMARWAAVKPSSE